MSAALNWTGKIKAHATVSAAKTNWSTNSTDAVLIYTGVASKEDHIDQVSWNAQGATSEGFIFLITEGSGGALALAGISRVPARSTAEVAIYGPANGVIIPFFGPLSLPTTSDKLYVATYVAETFKCIAFGRQMK